MQGLRLTSSARGAAICASGFLRMAALAVVGAALAGNAQAGPAPGSNVQATQSFALTDLNDLAVAGGKAETVEYQGRKAMRLTTEEKSEEVFAFLKGSEFQDGTIEADIALKTTTPPGMRMPGFVGIAFRARGDASRYDMFYLRPGNSHSEDQAMRNHSVQYVAGPGYGWYKLRREWPSVYESHEDLQLEKWIPVKIAVRGRVAKLFVNGSENPSLIVNGTKGEDLKGGVALWGYAGEEAYFSNVKITPAEPEPLMNGGEAAGSWAVDFASDYGRFKGTMELHREGAAVKGTWSGDFGDNLPVSGTWRNGYVELRFTGTWPEKEKPGAALATLAGWIDGDAARGRGKVEDRADGQWTATRKK